MSRRNRRKFRRFGQVNLQHVGEAQNINFAQNTPTTEENVVETDTTDTDYNDIPPVPPEQEPLFDEPKSEPGSKTLVFVAILAAVLVIASGYIVFNYFNQSSPQEQQTSEIATVQVENQDNEETVSEGIIEEQENEVKEGRIGTGASTVREVEPAEISPVPTPAEEAVPKESTADESKPQEIATQSAWTANDYNEGDIKPAEGKYTVVSGDTLWEISEAVYGNGADWHKIASANNVDYLAIGNPLIIPGQVLVL